MVYAEALNELSGSYNIPSWRGTTYAISRDIKEIQRGTHPVRIRAGVPDYPAQVYTSKGIKKNFETRTFYRIDGRGTALL